MKLAAILVRLACPVSGEEFSIFSEPPAVRFPRRAPVPLVFRKKPDPHALIKAAALKHKVPAAFVKSIVAAESNFDVNAISSKGAIGLMQLMPDTAQEYGADPRIPEQNVDAGTRYLRALMDKYRKYRDRLRRVIAAYNAGPGVVDRYRGVPPYRETRGYVEPPAALPPQGCTSKVPRCASRKAEERGVDDGRGQEEYIRQVREAYRKTPGTMGTVRRADRILATQHDSAGCP